MKTKEVLFVILAIGILVFVIYLPNQPSQKTGQSISSSNINNSMALNLTSSVFENNGNIPSKYTCEGEGINPALNIEGVDPNAKFLTLIMDDPDAASVVGHTFDHWVRFNIPPTTLEIEEGKEPAGTAGKNGAGGLTYAGPCPPNGTHHYYFKLYSLDQMLALPEGASKAEVEAAMQGHILQQAELIGLYAKKQ